MNKSSPSKQHQQEIVAAVVPAFTTNKQTNKEERAGKASDRKCWKTAQSAIFFSSYYNSIISAFCYGGATP